MLKFIVVLTRREGTSAVEFERYFKEVHEPLAKNIPGLKREGNVRSGTPLLNSILTTGRAWSPHGHRRRESRPQRIWLHSLTSKSPHGQWWRRR